MTSRGNWAHHRARQAARQAAMIVLSHNHPQEFEELLKVEMKRRGVIGSPQFGGAQFTGQRLDEQLAPTGDTRSKS